MRPYYADERVTLYHGDALSLAQALPEASVNCIVTSPPYWGLRDYGHEHQIGLEETPDEYVAKLVRLFGELKRVLRDDGTVWLNLGDSYGGDKNLVGIPWRVAFALQADGWYLRSDIVWYKPNPMPESIKDRPTRSHEYIFLLAKRERYYYDADAIKEPISAAMEAAIKRGARHDKAYKHDSQTRMGKRSGNRAFADPESLRRIKAGRNKRDVWTVPTVPSDHCHFAVFPPDLIRPCILAGCPEGGTVLDPFIGSGTTAVVARGAGRSCIGFDINAEYLEIAKKRLAQGVLL